MSYRALANTLNVIFLVQFGSIESIGFDRHEADIVGFKATAVGLLGLTTVRRGRPQ